MGPRLRRRLWWAELRRMFEHPLASMSRTCRRQRGRDLWRAYTRRRRDLYPDSVADWELT